MSQRRNRTAPGRSSRRGRRAGRGFTLIETIMVIALLGMVSATLLSMQPKVFLAQTIARDQYVGLEQMRACAERILAVRRSSGYASVTTTAVPPLCNKLGGQGNSDPTFTLTADSNPAAVTSCSSSTVTCTATISIAKTSGPAATATPLTVQISVY